MANPSRQVFQTPYASESYLIRPQYDSRLFRDSITSQTPKPDLHPVRKKWMILLAIIVVALILAVTAIVIAVVVTQSQKNAAAAAGTTGMTTAAGNTTATLASTGAGVTPYITTPAAANVAADVLVSTTVRSPTTSNRFSNSTSSTSAWNVNETSPVCTSFSWIKMTSSSSFTYYQPYINNPSDCRSACISTPNCTGIMWYSYNVYGCYLSNYSSIFHGYDSSYTYYALQRNLSSCDESQSCLYVWIGMYNRQGLGAVRDNTTSTVLDCVAKCQFDPSCSGLDWDTYNYYCWLFLNWNGTIQTQYAPYIYHFDKTCRDPYATTTTVSTVSTTPSNCPVGAVQYCEPTKTCLYAYQRCDKIPDCPNDIDESNCYCDSNHYQCQNGRCIYRSWLCDGVVDCPLGDDEKPPQCNGCSSGQFLCGKTNTCIMSSQRCDGVVDCFDSSDESSCLKFQNGTDEADGNVSTSLVGVNYKGVSGYYICSVNWDESWSKSLCKQMGYPSSLATSYRNVLNGSFLTLNLSVSSPNLMAYLTKSNCTSNRAVAVSCVQPVCGIRTVPPDEVGPYIINGQIAKRGAWPWQVLVELGSYPYRDDEYFYVSSLCGGVLIDERWILTAAHCTITNVYSAQSTVNPSYVRITLGTTSRLENNDTDTVYSHVDKVFTYPSYTYIDLPDSDVGLMRLSEPVNFTDTIRPICLPSPTEDISKFKVCVNTGFGRNYENNLPNDLQQARMNIIPYKDCYYYSGYYIRSQTQICVGTIPTEGDINICKGDSGGPLACKDENDIWKVIGINSYVLQSCYRSGVARVTQFVQWIQQTIAANSV